MIIVLFEHPNNAKLNITQRTPGSPTEHVFHSFCQKAAVLLRCVSFVQNLESNKRQTNKRNLFMKVSLQLNTDKQENSSSFQEV